MNFEIIFQKHKILDKLLKIKKRPKKGAHFSNLPEMANTAF
jgi:hypothetical protein